MMKKRELLKKSVLLLTLVLSFYFPAEAQKMKNDNSLDKRVREMEDRIALKELVDNFSILADKKDVKTQVLLFTADAVVETYRKDVFVLRLTGRKEMENAFGPYLNTFETVYHFNGQQTVTINGDRASGVSYCMVTLIGVEGGKRIETTFGIHYQDEFVRENGRWLIAKRRSVFDWEDRRELGQ